MMSMKRVITGHDNKGKSIVALNAAPVEVGTLFEA